LANKSGFIILLVIIAILTVSVSILAGYIFLAGGAQQQHLETLNNIIRRPSDKELSSKKLYEEEQYFVLKSEGTSKISFIRIGIDIKFFKKVKGVKNCEEKINGFESEIKELVGTYFQNVAIEEVKDSAFKIKAKEELKTQINDLLNSSEKIYSEIVYDIVFYDWFYQ
jgi:flagellar basal body-associated protein FliL